VTVRGRNKPRYSLLIWCSVPAVFLCAAAFADLPSVSNVLPPIVVFSAFAVLTELLGVEVVRANRLRVAPTAPVLWASAITVGPLYSLPVCIVGVLASRLIERFCQTLREDGPADVQHRGRHASGRVRNFCCELCSRFAANWPESGTVRQVIGGSVPHFLAMVTGLMSGCIVYSLVGGTYLAEAGAASRGILSFIPAFAGLAATYTLFEQAVLLLATACENSREPRGQGSRLMKLRVHIVENTVPIIRTQALLVFVSLPVAYLYKHIGIVGVALAVLPVVALSDFYRVWVEEKATYVETITSLATYMQHYHPYTLGHLRRVARVSEMLAQEMKLPLKSVRNIPIAAFLHDIGKIAVSEEILDKPGTLTEQEWAVIREHPIKGAEIIKHLDFLGDTVMWIKYHHKWYNGAGYPGNGLSGNSVPIESAVIAVVDAYDAMTDDRDLAMNWRCDICGHEMVGGESRPDLCPSCAGPRKRFYREPRSVNEAVEELRRGAGSQFHPAVVSTFLSLLERGLLGANERTVA